MNTAKLEDAEVLGDNDREDLAENKDLPEGELEEAFLGEETEESKEANPKQEEELPVMNGNTERSEEKGDNFIFIIGLVAIMMTGSLLYCMCVRSVGEEEAQPQKVVNAEDTEMTSTSVTDYA